MHRNRVRNCTIQAIAQFVDLIGSDDQRGTNLDKGPASIETVPKQQLSIHGTRNNLVRQYGIWLTRLLASNNLES